MKTIILTFALAIITSLTFAQFPQSDSPDSCCYVTKDLRVAIFMDSDSIVNIKMAKNPGEVIKIKVMEDNKLLYQRRIKSHEIANLKYDISQFPNGKYEFEIIKDKEVVFTKTIEKGETIMLVSQP
jgi:ribosomal protein L24E